MNIRIKIAEFPRQVKLFAESLQLSSSWKSLSFPQIITAEASGCEVIDYMVRIFHKHDEKTAEQSAIILSSLMGNHFDIIEPGRNWGGREIKRFWVVLKKNFSEAEAKDFLREMKDKLPVEYKSAVAIEWGILAIHPKIPTNEVILRTLEGEELHRGNVIRLHAPKGICIGGTPVGETFHWEHREDLHFEGTIELRAGARGILVINELPLEDYLASVNSSEMSAEAPLEFLKAQTIAARGTVAATSGCHHYGEPFDLCNGDHCQCYYGSKRIEPRSQEAAESTSGKVLLHSGIIADTRYAKICGGLTEEFNFIWEDFKPPYLPSKFDGQGEYRFNNIVSYIKDNPVCWCNPQIHPYPKDFDYATPWFRWKFEYERDELSELIRKNMGYDLNGIDELMPLKRGKSGRITQLKVGRGEDFLIEGELNIRRALSDSHLPSSCFVIDIEGDKVILEGAGWGHGVGMCQLGALNMATVGKKYGEILDHYYPGTKLSLLY